MFRRNITFKNKTLCCKICFRTYHGAQEEGSTKRYLDCDDDQRQLRRNEKLPANQEESDKPANDEKEVDKLTYDVRENEKRANRLVH